LRAALHTLGKQSLTDVLETMGHYFDILNAELFGDHSQIVQLGCPRSGIWGTKSVWGRVPANKG
jgi:phosphosulfolactate synthase (CoM biosynthesis protein A)